jgi:tellurite methyltransferase
MEINDKEYWTDFYSKNLNLPQTPSPFAQYLVDHEIAKPNQKLVELGCGNGRDSIFFAKNDILVTAIDQCENTTSKLNQLHNIHSFSHDFTNLSAFEFHIDVIYSRFTLHSITEEDEERTLLWAFNNLSQKGVFCIEARTLKDPIFGKGIDKGNHIWFYNQHHRRFIDAQLFKAKLVSLGFEIQYFEEKDGFARYKDDNPVVLRAIVKKP